MDIILASSSPFRKALFERLHIPFTCTSPEIDETPLDNEPHIELVERLACEKAHTVLNQHPDALCIGSDTLVSYDNIVLGKPHDFDSAVHQLKGMEGKIVTFYTSVCVTSQSFQECQTIPTVVKFKDKLDDNKIRTYLKLEEPFFSCGSFRSETSAVALIDFMKSDDPTAIIGLPLIALSQILEHAGVELLRS